MPAESYEKIEKIGQGNYGTVWKGRNIDNGDVVAIKIIDLENTEEEIDDVQKEIAALSNMKSKNVTKYYESFVEGNNLWIIMEYLGGGSVKDVILSNKEKGLEEVYIAIILKEVLRGLKYMHSLGQIHRDIKSANILLASNGDVKLADFGVVGQLTDEIDKRITVVGTPWWMAPEVILGKPYGILADIWSVGITAMEMALGRPPLSNKAPTRALFLIPRNPPPALRGQQHSEELKEFVELCLQKDAEDRPTATMLLETKFIQSAKGTTYLTELMKVLKSKPKYNQCTDSDSKEENEDDEGDGDWQFQTIKPMKPSKPYVQAPVRTSSSNNKGEPELKIDTESEGESSGEANYGTIVQRAPKKAVETDIPSFEEPSADEDLSLHKEPSYIYTHPLPAKIRRLFDDLQNENTKDRALSQSLGKLRMEVERLNDNYVEKIHQIEKSDMEIRNLKVDLTKSRNQRDRGKAKRRGKKKRSGHKKADSRHKKADSGHKPADSAAYTK